MSTQQTNTDIGISSIPNVVDLTSDSSESEIRKRLSEDINTSYIWSNFTLYEKGNENNKWDLNDVWNIPHQGCKKMVHTEKYKKIIQEKKEMILICNHCGDTFSFYSNGSSPNAKNHMEKVHPELLTFKKPQAKRAYGSIKNADDFKHKANILLASTMVSAKQPFNIVSNEHFRDFVEHIQTETTTYIVPSPDSFSKNIIPDMSKIVIEQIKKELQNYQNNIQTITNSQA